MTAISPGKRYRLAHDVTAIFRGDYRVTAPKGTRLEYVKGAIGGMGDFLAIPPSACDAGAAGKAGTWSLFGHDSKYFFIWAPAGSWEEIPPGE